MKELRLFVLKLAEAYGYAITPARRDIYAEALLELGEFDLNATFKTLLATSAHFPSVAAIYDAAEANENGPTIAANKILGAIVAHGYSNAQSAAQELGPKCWQIVQRLGGWSHLCRNHLAKNDGILRAQIRDLAKELKVVDAAAGGSMQVSAPSKVEKLISSTVKEVPK